MYIYVDIIFTVNFFMNIFILYLTSKAAGAGTHPLRFIIAASMGSIYAVGGVVPGLELLYGLPAKVLLSLLLVRTAFKWVHPSAYFLQVGSFYVASFVVGGAVTGWMYLIRDGDLMGAMGVAVRSASFSQVLFIGCLSGLLAASVLGCLWRRRNALTGIHRLSIKYNGRIIDTPAKLDTGNALYSLIGRKPVILAEYAALRGLFSEAAIRYLDSVPPKEWLSGMESCGDAHWLSRIEIIPCKGVGGSSLLLGFRPDLVEVEVKEDRLASHNAVIGIYCGKLASDSSYAALLHPDLINKPDRERMGNACVLPGQS